MSLACVPGGSQVVLEGYWVLGFRGWTLGVRTLDVRGLGPGAILYSGLPFLGSRGWLHSWSLSGFFSLSLLY